MSIDRKDILLRAAYDLLKKANDEHFVTEATAIVVHYDGADCDGFCLIGAARALHLPGPVCADRNGRNSMKPNAKKRPSSKARRRFKALDAAIERGERLAKIVEILEPFENRTKSVNVDNLHQIYKLAKGAK